MKRIILYLSFIVVSIFQLNAQVVSIPDANFKSVLLANPAINTNNDNEIQVAEASAYTGAIIVNNQNIADMTGIEAFTQIETLVCSENQITSINLSNNTALSTFICSNNQLTSLDVSSNTALTTLLCDNNQLASLDLSNNTVLTQLNCSNNQLSSLDLSTNTALTNVRCSHNQIATLNLSNTQNLQDLYCDNNMLSSLNLNDCVSLATLYCDSNQISSLDFSYIGSIQHIQCSSNNLTTLNLGPMAVLEFLDCSHNQLTSIDINGVTTSYFKYLNCSYNQIDSLDATSQPGLINIFCSQNQLTSININGLTDLESLVCSNNQLDTLNLNTNTSLTTLLCDNNVLTILDLSLNANLISLDCSNNNLDSLNVANGNNTNVQVFKATANPNLECIFVDDADYSRLNWTNIDPGVGFSDGNPSVGIDTHFTCSPFTWIDGNTYSTDNNIATFRLTCDSIVKLNLTIENVSTSVTLQNNVLTATDTTQGLSYQWVDCQNGNLPISGATNPTFEPVQNGKYAVIITTPNGCSDTSACHVINTLSIKNNPILDKQITIYPNPTSDIITVQTDLETKKIVVLDLQGKKLLESTSKQVDLSKLTSGIYLIKVELPNNENWTSKVIRE